MAFCKGCHGPLRCGRRSHGEVCDHKFVCVRGHAKCNCYCGDCYEEVSMKTSEWGDICNKKDERILTLEQEVESLEKANENLSATMKLQVLDFAYLHQECIFMKKLFFDLPGNKVSASCGEVTLSTPDGGSFLAHRLILGYHNFDSLCAACAVWVMYAQASRSSVFKVMLESDLKEGKTGQICIQNVSGKCLRAFLTFLYTAELDAVDMRANIRGLVQLAHQYEVKLLLLRLDNFASKVLLTRETAIDFLKMAYLFGLTSTKEAALQIIDQNHWRGSQSMIELEATHPTIVRDLLARFATRRC